MATHRTSDISNLGHFKCPMYQTLTVINYYRTADVSNIGNIKCQICNIKDIANILNFRYAQRLVFQTWHFLAQPPQNVEDPYLCGWVNEWKLLKSELTYLINKFLWEQNTSVNNNFKIVKTWKYILKTNSHLGNIFIGFLLVFVPRHVLLLDQYIDSFLQNENKYCSRITSNESSMQSM